MDQICKWLAVLGRLENQYIDQQLKDTDIGSRHHIFVVHVCNNPGITQDRLRNMVYIHPSNITRALDHLERHGYITRVTLPRDKRTCKLYPTEKAKQLHPAIHQILLDWVEEITAGMTEEQTQVFANALCQAGQTAANLFFPE